MIKFRDFNRRMKAKAAALPTGHYIVDNGPRNGTIVVVDRKRIITISPRAVKFEYIEQPRRSKRRSFPKGVRQ